MHQGATESNREQPRANESKREQTRAASRCARLAALAARGVKVHLHNAWTQNPRLERASAASVAMRLTTKPCLMLILTEVPLHTCTQDGGEAREEPSPARARASRVQQHWNPTIPPPARKSPAGASARSQPATCLQRALRCRPMAMPAADACVPVEWRCAYGRTCIACGRIARGDRVVCDIRNVSTTVCLATVYGNDQRIHRSRRKRCTRDKQHIQNEMADGARPYRAAPKPIDTG